jgi:hypothetical protein
MKTWTTTGDTATQTTIVNLEQVIYQPNFVARRRKIAVIITACASHMIINLIVKTFTRFHEINNLYVCVFSLCVGR